MTRPKATRATTRSPRLVTQLALNLGIVLAGSGGVAGCGGESTDGDGSGPQRPSPTTMHADAGADEPTPRDAGDGSGAGDGAAGSGGNPIEGDVADSGSNGGSPEGEGGSASSLAGAGGAAGGADVENGGSGGTGSSSGGSGSSSGGASAGAGGDEADAGGSAGASSSELCEWGSFDTDLSDEGLSCVEWSVCQPGTFVAEHGGFTQDQLCEVCPSGTFGTELDALFCDPVHRCYLGEQIATEATATSDRTCAVAASFPPSLGTAGPLVVTDDAARLLVWPYYSYPNYSDTVVANYSLDGEAIGNWFAADGGIESVVDMVQVGEDTFIAGARQADGVRFLRKLNADGTPSWEKELEGLEDYNYELGLAGGDAVVHVAANFYTGDTSGTQLAHQVFDLDGNLQSSTELVSRSYASGDGRRLFVQAATDGHLFVGAGTKVLEFDAADELVVEHSLGDNAWLVQLARDAAGGAYALVNGYGNEGQSLAHLGPDGQSGFSKHLPYEDGSYFHALTATPDAVLVVGLSNNGPVLVTTDLEGEGIALETLSEFEYAQFTAVRQTVAGAVLVAGTANSKAFVFQWPE